MKIPLEIIIDGLEMVNDFTRVYYDKHDQTIHIILDNEADDFDEDYTNMIFLPSHYEINEYDIMQNFVRGLEDKEKREILTQAIKGRGAFRNFKDQIYRLDIHEKWFEFRHESFTRIAVKLCVDNGLECMK